MIELYALAALAIGVRAQNACNPLTSATCPPIKGLPSKTYSIDFTKQTSLPEGWILADSANVTFSSNGATFWFDKRGNAPYIWTDFYLAYGTVDVELQVSNGTGIITSSVLFSDDQDEIDWEFSGSNFAASSGKAYTNYFGKGITGNYDRATLQDVTMPQKTFHTYSFDWTPERLRWIIDGSERKVLTNNGQTTGDHQYPQTPARLHLGMWDAGDPNTAAGTVNWAGGYTNYSNVPYHATVRSVRITTPFPCAGWQYPTNFSGEWVDVRCINDTALLSNTSTTQSSSTRHVGNACTASVYTVQSGDQGYVIAQRFGIDFNTLSTSNSAVNWNALIINQLLDIPCNITTTGAATTSPAASPSPVPIDTAMRGTRSSSAPTTSPIMLVGTVVAPIPTFTSTGMTPAIALTTISGTVSALSPSLSAPVSTQFMLLPPEFFWTALSAAASPIPANLSPSSSYISVASSVIQDSSSLSSASSIALLPNWKYKSCVTDNLMPRSLNVTSTLSKEEISNENCVSHCNSRGYVLAGTEWRRECYCGMQLFNSTTAPENECDHVCYGNRYELCGGSARLSLFYKDVSDYTINNTVAALSTTVPFDNTTQTVSNVLSAVVGTTGRNSTNAPSAKISQSNVIGSPLLVNGGANSKVSSTTDTSLSSLITSLGSGYASGSAPSAAARVTMSTVSILAGSSINCTSCTVAVMPSKTCSRDSCLRLMQWWSSSASSVCAAYSASSSQPTALLATVIASACGGNSTKISSACNCLSTTSDGKSTISSAKSTGYNTASSPGLSSSNSYASIPTSNDSMNVRGGSTWSNWRKRDGKDYNGEVKVDRHEHGHGARLQYGD